jgi:hypothetical protein
MTFKELQVKVELWKTAWPELTARALKDGAGEVAQTIKNEWSGIVLQRRSGKLVNAIRTQVKLNPLTARVYVEAKQQYKAQTFEHGKTIVPKKAPYLIIKFGNIWRKVKQVTIHPRPVFKDALESRKSQIFELIRYHIMEGYKKL